jgi:hypothetical protein
MLLLSVVVIGLVAAGYGLTKAFGDGMGGLGGRASAVYTSGDLGR